MALPLLRPDLVLEFVEQRDRIHRARACRIENRLVIRPFRVQHHLDVVVAQAKHFRGNADAFGVARAGASIDLDAIGHMTEWGWSALR